MTDSRVLDKVVIAASSPVEAGVVIWLHGLGADGHDFAALVPMLGLPGLRFVFPHAPHMPVTINGGWVMRAWYDIRTLEEGPDREDQVGMARTAASVAALIAEEITAGTPAERIVLAGFSQGAAMALHVGLRQAETLAGILILSGYVVAPERLLGEAHAANLQTPMLFCHGRHDPVVPPHRGRQAYDKVAELADRPLQWLDYPMEHEVCPAEVTAIGQWLAARLPGAA